MIYKLEFDSSYEYDFDAGVYQTIEEKIIAILTYLKEEGYSIYEYIVDRKSIVKPLYSIPITNNIFGKVSLYFYEKKIEDYSYEISSVNKLILTRKSLKRNLSEIDLFSTKDNLEKDLLQIFEIQIQIVESANITINTRDIDVLKKIILQDV
ncbi:hypothetical protein [Bacillus sp. Marseille-P3800]|uniref:hypothetical protein n=1 Tax=Bacillus sp. Marseille-P3800 TaxID=2014782 RepID=UPI000C06B10E|nr:hypothetical protein [Bacillus sp. Marseille-P3800]